MPLCYTFFIFSFVWLLKYSTLKKFFQRFEIKKMYIDTNITKKLGKKQPSLPYLQLRCNNSNTFLYVRTPKFLLPQITPATTTHISPLLC